MPSPSPVVAIAPPPVDSVAGWYVHLTVIVVFYARVNKLKTITISCYSFGLFVRLFSSDFVRARDFSENYTGFTERNCIRVFDDVIFRSDMLFDVSSKLCSIVLCP